MSIGLLSNIGGSAAGAPFAQLRGSDVDRAQQESSAQELRAEGDLNAEEAAGVGQTDGEDHETADRDADGRLPWQLPNRQGQQDFDGLHQHAGTKDPSGQSGNALDLSG